MNIFSALRARHGSRRHHTKRIVTDFDGIYNPLGYLEARMPWPDMEYGSFTDRDGDTINVFTSPTVLRFLTAVANRDNVELLLLSTWCNHIDDKTFTSFGFPEITLLTGDAGEGIYYDTKLKNLLKLPDDMDTLWLEDELTAEDRAALAEANTTRNHPIIVIAPTTHYGLEPHHLDEITAFLER